MKRWVATALPVLFLLGLIPEVRGNGAPPPFRPGVRPNPFPIAAPAPQPARLVVEIDDSVKEPRLVIPTTVLFPAVAPPRRGADAGPLPLPTVMGGLALTAGFVSCGFWLVRRDRGRTLASCGLALSLLALGASALQADLLPGRPAKRPPFPQPQPFPQQPQPLPQPQPQQVLPALPALKLPAGIQLPEKITVQLVPGGDAIRLIVNKGMILQGGKDEAEAKPDK